MVHDLMMTKHPGQHPHPVENLKCQAKGSLLVTLRAFLTSGTIDISGTEAFVSLDLESDGSLEDNEDFVKLFASVDGGAFELIGEKSGQQALTTIDGFIQTGDRLVLRIEAATSSSKEKYFLDNLLVIGEKVDDGDLSLIHI